MSTREEKLRETAEQWRRENVSFSPDGPDYEEAIEFGANWQREQDAELMRAYEGAVYALEYLVAKRAASIFIEEPEHVEHFFKRAVDALAAVRAAKENNK